jgi:ribose-phosphate pyrophosphokinase
MFMENVVFLADKNSRSWNFAVKIQEYIQNKKCENFPLYDIPIGLFRNGEIEVNPTKNLRKKDVYFIHDSSKNPQQWWVELLLVKDMALNASANSLTFVLPNLLYSRQDRKIKSRVPISSRALANSISPGVKKLFTMDLHAGQVQGFYPANSPLDNLFSFPEVVRYLVANYPEMLKNLLILSPDAGGVTRAKAFLNKVEKLTGNKCEIAFVIKERARPGEVGEMRYVGPDPKGKNVLIVDDIIDTGGTLCNASDLLRQKGVEKVFCYATHGIFTKGLEDLNAHLDKIFTSNTHYQEGNGVEVIDVCPVFAEAIFRSQKGYSISELFV